MKVEVAVLGALSLIVRTVSVDGKATLNLNVQELYLTAQLLPKVGTGVCDDRDDVGQVTGGEGISS